MIEVRNAVESDLPAMLEIYNDVILHTTAVYEYQPHTLDMRRAWFNGRKEQGLPVFVAVEGDQVLGMSSFGPFRQWAAYQHTVEISVYVAAAARGKGIGKMLVQPLIDAARRMGKHTMVAGIDASNEASIALHRSFGFEEVARFKQVGWKFDRWLDLTFFQLML